MSRNYKKERKWQLRKYNEIRANIDRKLGLQLRQKLKEEKKTIASWITEHAENYVNQKHR